MAEIDQPTFPEVYDPRTGKKVVSVNPALIFAWMLEARIVLLTDEQEKEFWAKIGKLADWLDETEEDAEKSLVKRFTKLINEGSLQRIRG